jgi:16S rRNA (uracil1498-N3)-methyltransferase
MNENSWQHGVARCFQTASGHQRRSKAPSIRIFSDLSSHEPSYENVQHLPRLYVETESESTPSLPGLRPKALIPLTTGQAHYLLDVMRITNTKRWRRDHAGHVRIFNGRDGEWLAKVLEPDAGGKKPNRRRRRSSSSSSDDDSDAVVLECIERLLPQPHDDSASPGVELYLGRLKKKQQLRWVLEKVTELGVDGITVLDTEYSMGDGSDNDAANRGTGDPWDFDKHKAHVIEAAEQCERMTLPTLQPNLLAWNDLIERMQQSDAEGTINCWLVCRERSETSPPILSALLDTHARYDDHFRGPRIVFHILVGPEGGWSPAEIGTFENMRTLRNGVDEQLQLNQVQCVSLGPSVLRAETAAVAAVACVKMHHDVQAYSE